MLDETIKASLIETVNSSYESLSSLLKIQALAKPLLGLSFQEIMGDLSTLKEVKSQRDRYYTFRIKAFDYDDEAQRLITLALLGKAGVTASQISETDQLFALLDTFGDKETPDLPDLPSFEDKPVATASSTTSAVEAVAPSKAEEVDETKEEIEMVAEAAQEPKEAVKSSDALEEVSPQAPLKEPEFNLEPSEPTTERKEAVPPQADKASAKTATAVEEPSKASEPAAEPSQESAASSRPRPIRSTRRRVRTAGANASAATAHQQAKPEPKLETASAAGTGPDWPSKSVSEVDLDAEIPF